MAASMQSKLYTIACMQFPYTSRHIQTTRCLQNSFLKSKTMMKIMGKASRKKDSKWHTPVENDQHFMFSGSLKKNKRRFSDGMERRARCLSDVLFTDIAQIMAFGEIGVTATVTQVKVIADMSAVHIHWECSGDREKDEQTQLALNAKAKVLRHILIHSRTIGSVPMPVFIKDLSIARQREVENILERLRLENIAEQDDRETETDAYGNEKLGLANNVEKSENNKIVSSDCSKTLDSEKHQVALDSGGDNKEETNNIRQNMYGLQHDVLMKKVISSKGAAIQRPVIVSNPDVRVHSLNIIDLGIKAKTMKRKPTSRKILRQRREDKLFSDFNETFDTSNIVSKIKIDDDADDVYDFRILDLFTEDEEDAVSHTNAEK